MTAVTRRLLAGLTLAALAVAVVIVLIPTPGDHDADARVHATASASADAAAALATVGTPASPRADVSVTVGSRAVGRPIAPGFLGVSVEFSALPDYTGSDPSAVNPVFEQLLRNLSPGRAPVVRIGGNSSDSTWWPVSGMTRPKGVHYTLTSRWTALARALATDTGAKLILGINLAVGGPPLAATEARALLHRVGARNVQALEIGNEPKRYALFPWYRNAAGKLVYIRSRHYGYHAFSADFADAAAVMPPAVTLAGPTFGGMAWMRDLPRFLAAEPRVSIVTDHTYPLNRCWTHPGHPEYPTVPRLLSAFSSRHLIAGLPPYIALAHANGDLFRIDEMQSVACGGKFGVSDTFAAALWSMDTLFGMAREGVDGVNFHTFPKAAYALFQFSHTSDGWLGSPSPEYYGLAMFARAAPTGSRLLTLQRRGSGDVRTWATRGRDGTVRVLLINDGLHRWHTVRLRLPAGGRATVTRLTAPSVWATSGVNLGGATFAPDSGRLGRVHSTRLRVGRHGIVSVTLPTAGAALITLSRAA